MSKEVLVEKRDRVAVIDYYDVGHHPTYLNAFVEALSKSFEVVVFSPSRPENKSIEWHEISPKIDSFKLKVPGRRRLFEIYRNWWLSRKLRACGDADSIFFACVYGSDFKMVRLWSPFFRGYKVSGLSLNAKVEAVGGGWKTSLPAGGLGSLFNHMFTLDPTVTDVLEKQLGGAVSWLPETVNCSSTTGSVLATRLRKLAKGRRIVFLGGFLSVRKGLFEYCKVSRLLDSEQFFFVILGQLSWIGATAAEKKFISDTIENSENILAHPLRVGDEMVFNEVLSISSVAFCVYRNWPHSSNIIFKSSYLSVPALVAKGGLMDHLINDMNFGRSEDGADISKLANAIEELSNEECCEIGSQIQEKNGRRFEKSLVEAIQQI